MKKNKSKSILIAIVLVLSSLVYVKENFLKDSQAVTFAKIIDGDSFYLNIDNEESEVRLIGINCPEMKTHETYAQEATDYTYKLLTEAKEIEIEFDDESDRQDKYGRYLIYVFVDGELLQDKLLEAGLAEVKFVYGDYKYLDEMYEVQDIAKEKKLNIWQ